MLSDVWFDFAHMFKDGFAVVVKNNKENMIDCGGNLISDIWFDSVSFVNYGYIHIKLKNEYNIINTNGKLLSNIWFDRVYNTVYRRTNTSTTIKYVNVIIEG